MGHSDWIFLINIGSWLAKFDWSTTFVTGKLITKKGSFFTYFCCSVNNLIWFLNVNLILFYFHKAIAKDGIIPFIQPFAVSSSRGEPTRALILTICICQCGILLGMFCYCFRLAKIAFCFTRALNFLNLLQNPLSDNWNW